MVKVSGEACSLAGRLFFKLITLYEESRAESGNRVIDKAHCIELQVCYMTRKAVILHIQRLFLTTSEMFECPRRLDGLSTLHKSLKCVTE